MTGGNEREGVRRLESHRQDYSKSSSCSPKCPLITFSSISPSQKCKTTNNITTLTSCTTHQELRYMWDWLLQQLGWSGPQIKCFSRLCCRLVCTSSKKIWILELSAHESWWKCSARARDKRDGCSCWPLKVSAHFILSNTKEKKTLQYNLEPLNKSDLTQSMSPSHCWSHYWKIIFR